VKTLEFLKQVLVLVCPIAAILIVSCPQKALRAINFLSEAWDLKYGKPCVVLRWIFFSGVFILYHIKFHDILKLIMVEVLYWTVEFHNPLPELQNFRDMRKKAREERRKGKK
jgi:hypothetical protein